MHTTHRIRIREINGAITLSVARTGKPNHPRYLRISPENAVALRDGLTGAIQVAQANDRQS